VSDKELYGVHGDYSIQVQGEILITRFFQKWNLECAKDYFVKYKSFILAQKLSQWGALTDFSKFEGATPETILFMKESVIPWAINNGQIARAHIVKNSLTEYIINQSSQVENIYPTKPFKNETDAFSWLKKFGLSTGP